MAKAMPSAPSRPTRDRRPWAGPRGAKLRAWYLSRSPVAPEQARAILGLLLEHLPPERRDGVVRELAARMAVPEWVAAVLE